MTHPRPVSLIHVNTDSKIRPKGHCTHRWRLGLGYPETRHVRLRVLTSQTHWSQAGAIQSFHWRCQLGDQYGHLGTQNIVEFCHHPLKRQGPTGRAYSPFPDPLAGWEGTGCPVTKNTTPDLAFQVSSYGP